MTRVRFVADLFQHPDRTVCASGLEVNQAKPWSSWFTWRYPEYPLAGDMLDLSSLMPEVVVCSTDTGKPIFNQGLRLYISRREWSATELTVFGYVVIP